MGSASTGGCCSAPAAPAASRSFATGLSSIGMHNMPRPASSGSRLKAREAQSHAAGAARYLGFTRLLGMRACVPRLPSTCSEEGMRQRQHDVLHSKHCTPPPKQQTAVRSPQHARLPRHEQRTTSCTTSAHQLCDAKVHPQADGRQRGVLAQPKRIHQQVCKWAAMGG